MNCPDELQTTKIGRETKLETLLLEVVRLTC
uniref:Uncharacterized protein n=1 Tax=Rhizophora mucronata TaxID=61149 RepID=A0A2P2N948_RHIMU